MRDHGETLGGTSQHRHLVYLEVFRDSAVPQLALLVLFLVVVSGEALEVHGGGEKAVHALKQVILWSEDRLLSYSTSGLPIRSAALPEYPQGLAPYKSHPIPSPSSDS